MVRVTAGFCLALGMTAAAWGQDTRSFTDDLGRVVDVPAEPKRIVTLWDGFLTVPLLELGVVPAGSQGRGDAGGAYIRGAELLAGVDFAEGGIAWVGNYPVDIERILAVEPDLIITAPWMEIDPERLQQIAPTVSIDPSSQPMSETFAELAELTNTQERLAALQRQYEAQIARLKQFVPADLTVSTLFFAAPGEIYADNGAGNVSRILADIGLSQPEAVKLEPTSDNAYSSEMLQTLDADVILSLFYSDAGTSPADHAAFAEATLPDFCQRLQACRNGQMYYLPIEESYASSYTALGRIASSMLTVLAQPGLVRMAPLAAD